MVYWVVILLDVSMVVTAWHGKESVNGMKQSLDPITEHAVLFITADADT